MTWQTDPAFMAILHKALPAVYERYSATNNTLTIPPPRPIMDP